ncbi:DUF3801 domain-containing protein [Ihubacter sp. mB4P-1]|uniref:DUF3801 domain-containing protein n=1 Tax=Ihubacter sp. mB4P-1 TaxID=3242370 RepID=UPI003C7BC336
MSAEAEAAEILVRIMGSGINEMIKVGGTGALVAGRAAMTVLSYCYAVKVGGSPKEIAKNPGGMAIITIPEERLSDFRQAAKAYKMQYFSVNSKNYDKGYLDLCMKAEDVATCQRILEMTGIAAVKQTHMASELGEEALAVHNSVSFAEAAEKLKERGQNTEAAFNRNTDRDFARDTPYVLCDRLQPANFVLVQPETAEFRGQSYTKSTYIAYSAGVQAGIFDDGRFEGREKNYWIKTRAAVARAANLTDGDIIYFKDPESHKAYVQLSEGKRPEPVASVEATDAEGITKEIAAHIDAISKEVPAAAQEDTQTMVSEPGLETGKSEQKKPSTTKTSDITFEEKAESLKGVSQSFDAALNRHTEKNFARNTPYILCDRLHPDSYIEVTPEAAEFNGQSYTRSTYRVYRGGEYAGTFDDGKRSDRGAYYWGELKDRMRSAGGFENDMVYFPNRDALRDYQALQQTGKSQPLAVSKGLDELAGTVFKDVPKDSPWGKEKEEHPGGVRAFAAEYKEKQTQADPELMKAISDKLTELRGGGAHEAKR